MSTKYRPDEVIGNTLIELKTGMDTVGKLRTVITQLAYALTEGGPHSTGLLVLANPKLTGERLEREWRYAGQTLSPHVMERLKLVRFLDGNFQGLPQGLEPGVRARLDSMIGEELESCGTRVPSTRIYYELLKIMIHQWLLNKGPMTADWLAKTAGCSYPTVANALNRLSNSIARHAYRRIELSHFPREEWARLVAVSDRARSTMHYVDRSGQPRSPDSLLRRVQKLTRPDIAIGGVFGAKHYYADLDLLGNRPRARTDPGRPRTDEPGAAFHPAGSIPVRQESRRIELGRSGGMSPRPARSPAGATSPRVSELISSGQR